MPLASTARDYVTQYLCHNHSQVTVLSKFYLPPSQKCTKSKQKMRLKGTNRGVDRQHRSRSVVKTPTARFLHIKVTLFEYSPDTYSCRPLMISLAHITTIGLNKVATSKDSSISSEPTTFILEPNSDTSRPGLVPRKKFYTPRTHT